MSDAGIINLDLNGVITSKTGDFENESEENLNKLTKNILYILQDVNAIKTKEGVGGFGNFQKITLKCMKFRYEVAIGNSSIRIVKFNN
jgi:hypothetical protein